MKPKITFVLTGGTIDKEYDALDKAFTIGSTAVSRILTNIKPNFDTTIIPLLQKVSVNITDEEKELIYKTCAEAPNEKIILTYGTDAMTEIAERLKDVKGKIIVIVGALKSQLIKDTDAEFNLGAAVAAVQTVLPGVYIAMNGRIYAAGTCRKDLETGQFVDA